MMTVLLLAVYGVMSLVLASNLAHLARRRRARGRRFDGLVSILVPARNEQSNLERLLPSLLSQVGVAFEVIVYDDASDDDTAGVVERCADARIRLIRGSGPPKGWIGKVHALYSASRQASGDALLFLDADAALTHPHALDRILRRFGALPAHTVLTALPRFRGGARLIVSALPYGLLTFLPLALVRRVGRPLAALNGQCWLIGRADYFAHEPHLHHPAEVLEDVKIGRFLAGRGVSPSFADLADELDVWMYRDLAAAWRGFRKNAYLAAGGHPLPFLAFLAFLVVTHLVGPAMSLIPAIWLLVLKAVSDRFARMPLWVSALAPVTVVLCAGILVDSAITHLRGRTTWKGRNVSGVPS